MSDTTETPAARQAAILDAALAIFLRYGFKKTSMDDVARREALTAGPLPSLFDQLTTQQHNAVRHTNVRTGSDLSDRSLHCDYSSVNA